jgi:hypothetical protein
MPCFCVRVPVVLLAHCFARLTTVTYEGVLATLLELDPELFHTTLLQWPSNSTLYDQSKLTERVATAVRATAGYACMHASSQLLRVDEFMYLALP